MNEVYEFLKKCGTYYLATVEGYKPRVRPFGTIDLYNNRLYIQTGKVKAVSRQIKENPQIEICAMDDGKWIRIEATAYLDNNIDAQKHMLAAYPSLQKMYQPGDGNTEVFYLRNVTAKICSFTEEPKTFSQNSFDIHQKEYFATILYYLNTIEWFVGYQYQSYILVSIQVLFLI